MYVSAQQIDEAEMNPNHLPDPQPPFLDIKKAAEAVTEFGIPATERQVREWFDRGELHFFKGPDGRRYIAKNVLLAEFLGRQRRAIASRKR